MRPGIISGGNPVFLLFQNKFEFVNQKFEELFEITIDKLNNPDYDFLSLVHPDCRERVSQRISNTEAVDGNSDSFELRMISDIGKERYIDLYYSYFRYKGGIAKQGVLRDISRRKALEKRNVMLSKVIEQSPVSIVITDSNSDIEYVNPFFENRAGYSFEEAKGRNPRILKSGEHDAQFYKDMWHKLSNGEIWSGEIKNRHKDGSFYWENVRIAPVYDSTGRTEYFVALKEDITGIKKTLKELKIAKYKAEESDRLKTAFLANMSHEIRTPMNGIMGFIELLKEPDLSGEDKDEFIRIIQKSGDRMLNTISDLVDISILESGTISVNVSTVDIGQLVNDIYLFFANEAKAKGLEFGVLSLGVPCIINSDYDKIYSILNNIVKNAIKFTMQGKVSVEYRMNKNNTHFIISDTGIGIPENRKTAVFDRFVQADIPDTRVFEGSGLGLSIAKSYVELLNGKIWFESEENVGTIFYISIPNYCEEVSVDDRIASLVDNQDENVGSYNVLIVEDDETTVLLIKEIISPLCNSIYVESNGLDAVRFVQQRNDLDLILMDIKLPDLNGFESVKRIRSFNQQVKIIAQTAYAQDSDSDTAFKVGCNHYIAKPFSKAELRNIIQETMTDK